MYLTPSLTTLQTFKFMVWRYATISTFHHWKPVSSNCVAISKGSIPSPMLMAIISHFNSQLIGNKLSFTLCYMHILLISNAFHKFWMSCGCIIKYIKNEAKWTKYPGRPASPRLAILAPPHNMPRN